jgi:BirA family biotin operon repressor/biotin-[acetyl-CoA-carboxylase] ligase
MEALGERAYRIEELSQRLRPVRLYYLDSVGSTSSYAIEQRRRGELFAPAIVLAARQLEGRGRGGNSWWSGEGSMTATWVLPVEEQYAPHQLPLIVGLALRGACVELSGDANIQLKWPNDLLWQDRKLAGILCERTAGADFVGIGLNVSVSILPGAIAAAAISLSTIAGRQLDATEVVALINAHLARYLAGRSSRPFEALLQEFRECDGLLGREVSAQLPGEAAPLCGTCEGVDRDGALLLRTPAGLQRLIAGSISFADDPKRR